MTLNKMDDTLSHLHQQTASADEIVRETHELFFDIYSLYEEVETSFHQLEEGRRSEAAFLDDLSVYKIRGESLSQEILNVSLANDEKVETLVNALLGTLASIQDCIRYFMSDAFLTRRPDKRRLIFDQQTQAVCEDIQNFSNISRQLTDFT